MGRHQIGRWRVSEIRVHVGPGYRVYFTRRGQALVVLLCGGDKASQAGDILRAKTMAGGLTADAIQSLRERGR
ncbi:type II toxin-antitoxin system RelE/ParE family toxin [Caulobacter sp. 1776]|uniref:type II toxin-antitoxin system RelE/ParE family toxin n=1 Tax=Caulobacter sp. 1776 TaxID=3156420 RepID=UPI003396423C